MPDEYTSDDLHASFDAEIQRLITKGITDEEELIARRYYSQKERKGMNAGSFCGPHRSFPITNQADVNNAAHLVGHAANPAAVKACIKGKAKANGWSIPDSWKDGDSDRATQSVDVNADGSHDPFTGTHSHAHPSFGAGDDASHSHSHTHANDADHNHSHAGADIEAGGAERATMPDHAHIYAPIIRIDKEKREVECCATSEALDSFKTVFSYEGSKNAFQRWIERTANVREMHDRKAVGKGIAVRFDDANKKIYVGSRISRSADGENSWIKIDEGILNGYSVGAINPVWGTIERDGKSYPYLLSYDLAELSLVDNASNPDAQGFMIARAAELTELVDVTEPEPVPPVTAITTTETTERAGARLSSASRAALHTMRDQAMNLCNCDECQGMRSGSTDDDGDADDGPIGDVTAPKMQARIAQAVERALVPLIQRQQSILARFASIPEHNTTPTISIETQLSAFKAELSATLERVMQASSQDKTYSLLSEMQGQIERIAAQPQVGLAPILNGSRPVDKQLATDFRASQPGIPNSATVMQNLQALQAQGGLNTQDLQQAAARLMLQMQQQDGSRR